MAQPIPEPSYVVPRQAGTKNLCVFSQPYCGFADDLQLALHRGYRLASRSKASSVNPRTNSSMDSTLSRISLRGREEFLKGKNGLAFGPELHWLLQHLAVREFDSGSHNFG